MSAAGYRFGLEGEYLLAEASSFCPLWHDDLTFRRLNALLESIPFRSFLEGLSLDGLELDPPHRKLMPYYVEGYGPALVAFSLNAPVKQGVLWQPRGRQGLSVRTHRRSPFAPMLAYHPKEGGRVEFKSFDMPTDRRDFHPFFLLWVWLMADTDAPGRADDQDRIYDLGALAYVGWEAEEVAARAEEVLDRAEVVVTSLGLDPSSLGRLRQRMEQGSVPADAVIRQLKADPFVQNLLRHLDWVAEAAEAPLPAHQTPAFGNGRTTSQQACDKESNHEVDHA